MDSYIFNGNTETPETVARRRQVADALAAKIFGQAPTNLGSGIAAIGQALIARQMGQEADAAEATGRQSANAAFMPILGGGTPAVPPVATATPAATPASSGNAASAIAGIESGGDYGKLGPVTASGDRAYGKYQIMGSNIPEWTKIHLGQAMTPDQFLASPQAQDAVFNGQFGQYAQKYGPVGAAKAWFAGERGMNNPNARDQLGTSVQAYADRFAKAYGVQPGGQPYQVAGPTVAAPSAAAAAPTDVAVPAAAQPVQGALPTAQDVQASVPRTASQPGVTTEQLISAASNPWANKAQQAIAQELLKQRIQMQTPEYGYTTLPDGTVLRTDKRGSAPVPVYTASPKPTGTMQNLEAAGLKPGSPEYQKAMLDATKTGTNVQVNNTVNPILKGVGERFNEDMDTARNSVPQIMAIHEARKALDEGAITGAAANPKLFMSKAASLFGLGSDATSNTEVLRSAVGNSVLAKAKALGANPSNADRDYIEKVQGGSISLEESSIRRLLDMQEKWARQAIDRANSTGQQLLEAQPEELKNIAPLLSVKAPPTYDEYLKTNPIKRQPSREEIEAELRKRGILK